MEAFSMTETFPKIVEAYSRPTRIIRGKEIESALEVDPSVFEKDEEKVLWCTYLEVADKIHPGVDIKTFVDASLLLIQPLEDFFNNVLVMAVSLRCPSITFVSGAVADPCWVSY